MSGFFYVYFYTNSAWLNHHSGFNHVPFSPFRVVMAASMDWFARAAAALIMRLF